MIVRLKTNKLEEKELREMAKCLEHIADNVGVIFPVDANALHNISLRLDIARI